MDEREQRNTGTAPDVFTAVNNYFLLFFCASCVLSSMYIQQLFFLVGQYRHPKRQVAAVPVPVDDLRTR